MSQSRRSVVFIDAHVADFSHLLRGIKPGVAVRILTDDANGIEQMTAYLGEHPADIVHIVSHGAPGTLRLGNGELNLENLSHYAPALATWFAQAEVPSLLLYGCNVAAGDAGSEFIEKLHNLTGAALGASTTKVGSSAEGGSWRLNTHYRAEHQTLNQPPFSPAILENYAHTFDLPGARSAQVGTQVFLGGNYIELGLSALGDYGTTTSKPSNFFGTNARGTIGMSADFDGFNTGNDFRVDYFLPGTPEERWVVGYQSGGTTFKGSNSALMNSSNIPTTVTDTSAGSALSATVNGTFNSALQVDKVVSFDVDDKYFKTVITLTNVSGATIDSVRYMRSFDPDNTVDVGGDFSTINTVIGTIAGDGYAAVRATTTGPGDPVYDATGSLAPIFFISDDPRAVASYFGFSNTDPYASAAYTSPPDRGISRTADTGITLTFDVGSLTAGQSTSFSYYTSLDDRRFSEVLAEIYPDLPAIDSDPIGTVTISGNLAVGETLTAETFSLDDPDGLGEFSYRWEKSPDGSEWSIIDGAIGSTFTPTPAEGGKLVRAVVSFTDGEGNLEEIASSPTSSTIFTPNNPPTGDVTISGVSEEGYVLTADTSTLADLDGLGDLSYQWQQSTDGLTWTTIPGATEATFTLGEAQVGQKLRVAVSYTDDQGGSEQVTSAATGDAVAAFKPNSDFNGDGHADILWRNATLESTVVWLMSGPTIEIGQAISPDVNDSWRVGAVADFDGNGRPDLLWQNVLTGDPVLWLLDGFTIASGVELPQPGAAWQVAGAGDFNQDDHADILWHNAITGEMAVWLMNGTQPTSAIALPTVPHPWDVEAVGDFSRDGQTDILWRNSVSGETVVWLMDGETPTGAVTLPTVPVVWELHGAADFTGDTHLDLLWHNQITGEVVIWAMQGLEAQSAISVATVSSSWEAIL